MSDSQQSSGSDLSQDSLVGNMLGGRYSILARVAKGGTAVIYQARDTVLNREVAVKVLHEHLENRQEVVQRLKREAQLIAQLRHPNILTVYDFIQDRNRAVLVVEFMPGTTLSGIIQITEKIAEEFVLMITLEILQGLKAAHDAAITHRDIKPANILVHPELGVKISDFGLAKILDSDDGLTKEGVFVGTPSFSSPEQIEGRPIDHRSDLFSLGLTMYMLATRTHAFKNKGDSTTTVWYKTVKGNFDPMRDRNADVSAEFEKIVSKALQVDLDKRYSSASAMIEDIEKLLQRRNLFPYKRALQSFLKNPAKAKVGATSQNSSYAKFLMPIVAVGILGFFGFLFFSKYRERDEVPQSIENLTPSSAVDPGSMMPSVEPPAPSPIAEMPEYSPIPSPIVQESPASVEERAIRQKPKVLERKDILEISSPSLIVLPEDSTDWIVRIRWASGKKFRLVREDSPGLAIVDAEAQKPFWDLKNLGRGRYKWTAGAEYGVFEVMKMGDYKKQFSVKKRPFVVTNQFLDVDVEMNPYAQDLRFSWPAGPEAVSYRIDLASDEGMLNPIFSGSSTVRSLAIERTWNRDQTLYWRVSYLDDQKNTFFVDRVRKINMRLKGAPSGLELVNPRMGERLSKEVEVTFLAPDGLDISCREISSQKTDRDFKSLSVKGFIYSNVFETSEDARNIVCRTRVSGRQTFIWLF